MLVRDGEEGLELFLLKHVGLMGPAPTTVLLPGGGVDGRDSDDALPWAGPDPFEWAIRLGTDTKGARMLVVGAVREVFEECGVLLASVEEQGPLLDVDEQEWRAAREGLVARELSLCALLVQHGLVLRSDLLRAHAHWVTPEFEPKRYDIRVFVAKMPDRQTAVVKTGDPEAAGWFTPASTLAAHDAGEVVLTPTARICIEDAERFTTADEFFDYTPVIRVIEPRLVEADNASIVLRVDTDGRPDDPRDNDTQDRQDRAAS
jgi:8-oxo-dGTP pyrophosphatase MutT (NUDIX family)